MGHLQAVRDLDLDVGYGEIFAILGPNGAGKSTTIEILEGHRKRDAGQVSVLGEDPGTAGRSWRARIGIVLQETSDFGMLTVAETVRMFAKCYGKARSPEDLLELVGLASSSDSRVRTLSGGQRRRLDVALGIIATPELLFLDEPTTGFDPEARRQFWDLIRVLADEGTTIVLTTHYLEEAAALADRVAVIANGQVAAVDSPTQFDRAHERGRDGAVDGGRRAPRGEDRPSDRADQAAVDRRCGVGSAHRHPTHTRRRLSAPGRAGVMAIESESTAKPRHRADDSGSALPSPVRIGLSRVVPELKMFYRRPEQLTLTFTMPAVICVLLGSIFTAKLPGTTTTTGAVIAASMLAYGILSTSFVNLGIGIAADRETGALRRLRGTPVTASSYFIGKIMLVAIASVAEAVLLLLVGVLVFGLRLPTDVFGWFTLTWVFVLGIVSCSLLGIFVSNLVSNALSAAVITNGPAVGLQFVSGTYVPLMALPTWMLIVGSFFPVKWMAQGFRSVLLPPEAVAFEPAGSWEQGGYFWCWPRGASSVCWPACPCSAGRTNARNSRCPLCSRSQPTSSFRSPSFS